MLVDCLQKKADIVFNRSVDRAHERIKEAAEDKSRQKGVIYDLLPFGKREGRSESTRKSRKKPGPPFYPGPDFTSSYED